MQIMSKNNISVVLYGSKNKNEKKNTIISIHPSHTAQNPSRMILISKFFICHFIARKMCAETKFPYEKRKVNKWPERGQIKRILEKKYYGYWETSVTPHTLNGGRQAAIFCFISERKKYVFGDCLPSTVDDARSSLLSLSPREFISVFIVSFGGLVLFISFAACF